MVVPEEMSWAKFLLHSALTTAADHRRAGAPHHQEITTVPKNVTGTNKDSDPGLDAA